MMKTLCYMSIIFRQKNSGYRCFLYKYKCSRPVCKRSSKKKALRFYHIYIVVSIKSNTMNTLITDNLSKTHPNISI